MQPDSLIPDPSNPQAWNRYSYVLGNPLRYSDPTGHRNCEEDGYHCPGDDYKSPAKPKSGGGGGNRTPTPVLTPMPTPTPIVTPSTPSTPSVTPTIIQTTIPIIVPTLTPKPIVNPQSNVNPTPNGGTPSPYAVAPPIIRWVYEIYIGAVEGFFEGGDGAPGFTEVLGPAAAPLDVVLSLPKVWEKLNYVPSHGSSFVPPPVRTPYIGKPPIPIVIPTP